MRRRGLSRSVDTRLCTKKTWPSRSSSRRIAAVSGLLVVGADVGEDRVALLGRGLRASTSRGCRSPPSRACAGSAWPTSRARRPLVRSSLSCSLCSTPKRCSSSMTTRPRSLKRTSLPRMRWVPMTRSTVPSARPSSTALASRVGLEAGQRAHDCTGNPANRSAKVLTCCCTSSVVGHEHRDLLAVLDRLERRAHRDLGLAVADVAADQPVHRDRALHVGLDLVDGAQLVGRLDVGEGVLELALPRGVGRERVPGASPSARSRGGPARRRSA